MTDLYFHILYGDIHPVGDPWVGARGVIFQQFKTVVYSTVVNLPLSDVVFVDTEKGMVMAD